MQWQFDFKDWEEAFELFYRRKAKDDSLALVISTDNYTSGYWMEPNPEPDENTYVYRTVAEAQALEARVRAARRRAGNAVSLGGVIV
jgi:hypothetical protein